MATPDLKKNPRLAGEIAKALAKDFWIKYEKQSTSSLTQKIAKGFFEDSKIQATARVIRTEQLREALQAALDDLVARHPLPEPGRLVVVTPKDKRDPHSIVDWLVNFEPNDSLSNIETYCLLEFMQPENFNMLYRDCFTD